MVAMFLFLAQAPLPEKQFFDPSIIWTNIISVTGPLVVLALTIGWGLFVDSKKKHKQNQDILNGLLYERSYIRPHQHAETEGPLSAENIKFSPPQLPGLTYNNK